MAKKWRIIVEKEEEIEDLKKKEGQPFKVKSIIDEDTLGACEAEITVSSKSEEGFDELVVETPRGFLITGQWYVKIRREEEEEEEVTVFESRRFSDRRGYMLRSMMAEEKADLKEKIMTGELEERLRLKQEMARKVLEQQKAGR